MSGEDLLPKIDEIVAKRFNEIIERGRIKIKSELDTYNAKKQRMKAVQVSDNDIIYLNIGGEKITTKRSTLCQVEDSFLPSMFSGKWDSTHKRDEDGAVFLDYNPQYFVAILNYLRARNIATPQNPASLPKLPEGQLKDFKKFTQYLGLSGEIFPDEKFNAHSTGVTLQEGHTVATHGPNYGYRYVLGKNIYQQGIVRLKMKLESFQDNEWMFVGVAKADVVPPNKDSHKWPGSFGWGLGRYREVWRDRSKTIDKALKNVTVQGVSVELILDCDNGKLSLHLTTDKQFHIEIPKSQTWRLNVNMLSANDRLRIMNE
jgi:hypothetical protein